MASLPRGGGGTRRSSPRADESVTQPGVAVARSTFRRRTPRCRGGGTRTAPNRDTGPWRAGWVDPRFGLDPGLLVHRPHDGVLWRVEVEAADIGGFLPQKSGSWEVIHTTGLPGLEVEWSADTPRLRGRDRDPSSLRRRARASIVQRAASSGGGSVTVLTSSSTSSWLGRSAGRPRRSPSLRPTRPNSAKRFRHTATWL